MAHAPFRAIYFAIILMASVIIYLNSYANEDKPRLAKENRPYQILNTLENLKEYDRLCLNGPPVKCSGETICKVARVKCVSNTKCQPLMPICSDKVIDDYETRKFNLTSSNKYRVPISVSSEK